MYFSLSNKDIKDLNLLPKVGGIETNVFPYAFLLFSLFTTRFCQQQKQWNNISNNDIPKIPFFY